MCCTVESKRLQSCMNCFIVFVIVAFGLALLCVYIADEVSNGTFLSIPNFKMMQGFYFTLVAFYTFGYILLICNTFAKFVSNDENKKNRYFNCWNFKMVIMMCIISYPSIWGLTYV